MTPPVIYLTDCTDANARFRLSARIAALFGAAPAIYGLTSQRADLEASLTLLDGLQAATLALGRQPEPSIFLVNVAPREHTQWDNGTPFCYFHYGNHLVVATIDGQTLSLVQRYLSIETVKLVDIPTVTKHAVASGWLTGDEADLIVNTQYRSLWFTPLLARWLCDHREIPYEDYLLSQMEIEPAVYFIDNFGNCVIPKLPHEIGFEPGQSLIVNHRNRRGQSRTNHPVKCYQRLAEVPPGKPGIVIGSGGTGFVNLIVQGVSLVAGKADAASYFGLSVGDPVFSN